MKQTTQGKTIREYIGTAETKNRGQYTLKNILDLDQQYQKNYVTLKSERQVRTAPRPNTMYGDRLRIKLIDDNKNKMKSEMKIMRGRSQKVFRASSNYQSRKVTQDEKMRMKKAVGKINLLAEGNALGVNQEEQLETIFNFLDCLTEIDNHYQQGFIYLTNRLRSIVFANNKSELGEKAKAITQFWKNQYLINFVYRSNGRTTYQSLCREIFDIFMDMHQQMENLSKNKAQSNQHFIKTIDEKQATIMKLKRQLKYYAEHPSQDLYPYIKKLERENHESKNEIDQLCKIKDENQYRIQIFQNTNLLLSEQIETLKTKIYEFQLAQLSGMNEVEKSSELREFEKNIQTLKDMLEKSQLKMEGMKEQYDQVKEYNAKLINQRSILAKRAAVGYGQLTPRPKLHQIFLDNELIYDNYLNPQEQYSTQRAVQSLVEIVKLVSIEQLQAKIKKNKKKEKHEEKEITRQVMNQIQQTKQQVNITKISADKVKSEYNRQKKERESLERGRMKK